MDLLVRQLLVKKKIDERREKEIQIKNKAKTIKGQTDIRRDRWIEERDPMKKKMEDSPR